MRKEKLSLKAVKNVLNRDELKKIMAGSGTGTGTGGTGGPGCVQCAPACSSVLIFCYDSTGHNRGSVLGTTCVLAGQLQDCLNAGYSWAASTDSDCTCHPAH